LRGIALTIFEAAQEGDIIGVHLALAANEFRSDSNPLTVADCATVVFSCNGAFAGCVRVRRTPDMTRVCICHLNITSFRLAAESA
jgi:hypothetical protein